MASKSKRTEVARDQVVTLDENQPRVVTPDNPLNITTTPVSYDQVWIEGGDINVTVDATVTIAELKKVS